MNKDEIIKKLNNIGYKFFSFRYISDTLELHRCTAKIIEYDKIICIDNGIENSIYYNSNIFRRCKDEYNTSGISKIKNILTNAR